MDVLLYVNYKIRYIIISISVLIYDLKGDDKNMLLLDSWWFKNMWDLKWHPIFYGVVMIHLQNKML